MMDCVSRLETEDAKFVRATEHREAAERNYKEACQRLQICKKEEARVQRRRHTAYQLLLRAVHEVGAEVKER